ncbi:hypothetical protein F4861DRAFT_475395 [Xylaria intraflava]|nr:hypothetical protein F4861DRAFT_475395 [Xylaria intraflava]
MSVPPQLIHVKRKADEEAPVSYLRLQPGVQENKRHRSSVFVYQRQNKETRPTKSVSAQTQKPVIHTSSPSRQATTFQSIADQDSCPKKDAPADKDNATTKHVANSSTSTLDSASATEPRRFHMSRKDMMPATTPYPDRTHGDASKKRSAPALFIERKIRRISSKTVEKLHAASDVAATTLTPTGATGDEVMEVDKPEPRKLKKPGVAKLATRTKPKDKPELPNSMMDRWNVDMQQLTADMEAYAMQQIGLSLQKAEEEKRETERPKSKTLSTPQFKPKPPAKRYAERHPEEAREPADKEMVDADAEHSDSDDGDYIIETYVRVPASSMGDHVPPQTVGLLVFDEEPDLEFFYGEEDESEDEWAEDEEDENAENYYAADYPDEEVATDDEFDHNPYAFRTGNASDLEEFDAADVEDESDDSFDDESTTGQFRTYIGRNGLRSNHL